LTLAFPKAHPDPQVPTGGCGRAEVQDSSSAEQAGPGCGEVIGLAVDRSRQVAQAAAHGQTDARG